MFNMKQTHTCMFTLSYDARQTSEVPHLSLLMFSASHLDHAPGEPSHPCRWRAGGANMSSHRVTEPDDRVEAGNRLVSTSRGRSQTSHKQKPCHGCPDSRPGEFRLLYPFSGSASEWSPSDSNGTIILAKADPTRAGKYLCEASNGIGQGLSHVLDLIIKCA